MTDYYCATHGVPPIESTSSFRLGNFDVAVDENRLRRKNVTALARPTNLKVVVQQIIVRTRSWNAVEQIASVVPDGVVPACRCCGGNGQRCFLFPGGCSERSEEHTSELQSHVNL